MPSEVRFKEVRRLLENAGYRLDRIHGSHHIFTKDDAEPISIPVHRQKVKPFYVRQIKKTLQIE